MQIYCTPKICPLQSRFVPSEKPPANSVNNIIECGVEYYKQTEKELFSKDRYRPIVEARQSIMYALRSFAGLSLSEIGTLFNRDHTTVIYACKTVFLLIQSDQVFGVMYEGFVLELKRRGIIN